jgi:long-chain acyl-CoA synthetase
VIDVRSYASIGEVLWDATVQFKRRTALIEASRKRESGRWTFLAFQRLTRHEACRLQELGVQADTRVAILMSNQSKWLMTATATFWRGGVVVPLDYKLGVAEQQALIAHAKPHVVVVEYGVWRRHGAIESPVVLVTEAPTGADLGTAQRWEGEQPVALTEGGLAPLVEVERIARVETDLATIVYSSGTGGLPKGCMLTHGAYLSQLGGLLDLYPMAEGDRYFSILPTNHAIDFLCGFVGPLACGATVVHQRTLRPELIVTTMQRYRITHMAVVPLLLTAFERAIRERIEALEGWRRTALDAAVAVNRAATERTVRPALSRRLLGPIHDAFGGALRVLFCGGAFVDRRQAEFFYRLGLPVIIGYGLTEACTVATVHRLDAWRADSVGAPVAGVEVRIADAGSDGVGEVWLRGPTLMQGYLDAPELTAETLDEAGWLHTGDLGWVDASDHLHLVGRSKDMIVTAGGKNVYPEDVEFAFAGVPCEELAVFAANTLWPQRSLVDEALVVVVRTDDAAFGPTALRDPNRRLPEFKRVQGLLKWDEAFPRTASMKLKRAELVAQIRDRVGRDALEAMS